LPHIDPRLCLVSVRHDSADSCGIGEMKSKQSLEQVRLN